MATQFNSKKPDKEQEALDILLKGKSDEYKGRILEYVRSAKVNADDPTFVLMAALGNLDVALVELPQEIDKGKKSLREEIDAIKTEFQNIYNTVKQESQTQNAAVQTALTAAQTKISAIETAAQKLQTQINDVGAAQTSLKEKANNMSVAMQKTTNELANSFKRIEDRDSVKLWEVGKWRSHHWILGLSGSFILLFMMIDSWRMHSELSQVTADLRSATNWLSDISEKVGYDTVKLGRIEKYLGIKPKK